MKWNKKGQEPRIKVGAAYSGHVLYPHRLKKICVMLL